MQEFTPRQLEYLRDAGFEAEPALTRLNGRASVLKRLIILFCEDLDNALDRLDNFYQARDFAGIQQMAHQFKGSGANVGAMAISALAAQLESDIKNGNNQSYPQLRLQLKPYLDALAPLPTALADAQQTAPATAKVTDIDTILNFLLELEEKLTTDIVSAKERASDLQQYCAGSPYQAHASAVQAAIAGYDFDLSRYHIDEFRQQLGNA